MQDTIVITGAQEQAEVMDAAVPFKCTNCDFTLQVSGGIALNDNYQLISNGGHTCPKCNGIINVKNSEAK